MMHYYKVTTKCGHVGRGRCVWVDYAVCAENGKEAAAIARVIPRAKHDHPDCIKYVEKISKEEYGEIEAVNLVDPYLCCTTRRGQMCLDMEDRIMTDEYLLSLTEKRGKKIDFSYRAKKHSEKISEQNRFLQKEYGYIA